MKDDEILNEFNLKGLRDKFLGTFGLKGKEEEAIEREAALLLKNMSDGWKRHITGKKVKPTVNTLAQFLYANGTSIDTIMLAAKKYGLPKPRITKPKKDLKATKEQPQKQSAPSRDRNGSVPADDTQ